MSTMSPGTAFPCTANQMMVARLQAKGYVSNVPLLLRATGQLRQDSLREALQLIVDRHEVLRSVFTGSGDTLTQTPVEGVGIGPLPIMDMSHVADPMAAALDEVGADGQHPFDMTGPSRLRARLFRLGPDEYLVSLLIDHLAADGLSLGIITAEWRSFYQSLVAGTPFEIPAIAPQYRDFAHWQRDWLKGSEAEQLRTDWLNGLDGMEAQATVAAAAPYTAQLLSFQLDAGAARHLSALCVKHRIKPFAGVLACYAALLSVGTGEYDLIIGTVRANRRRPDTPQMVGHFANLVPLRTRVHRGWPVEKLLHDFAAVTAAAYARDGLPFADLASATWRARGIPASQLAEIAINFVPFPDQPVPWGGELRMEQLWRQFGDRPPATGRITLFVRYQQSALGGVLMYDPRTIDPAWADRFPEMLTVALRRLADGSAQTVEDMLAGFA
jgi:arthrofactin-type cyclic lipopeptide synthetase C